MKRWSKLKKQIESLFVPELNVQFNCNSFPIRGQRGHRNSIPRFYLQMGKQILWDFPKGFEIKELHFGWWADNNNVSALIREYIDTPFDMLLETKFKSETLNVHSAYKQLEKDYVINYRLTELFIGADRRIGKEKLLEFAKQKRNTMLDKLIEKRFPKALLKKTKNENN